MVKIIKTPQNGLDEDRGLNLSQLRTVDWQRFWEKQGEIDPKYFPDIAQAIMISLFGIFIPENP